MLKTELAEDFKRHASLLNTIERFLESYSFTEQFIDWRGKWSRPWNSILSANKLSNKEKEILREYYNKQKRKLKKQFQELDILKKELKTEKDQIHSNKESTQKKESSGNIRTEELEGKIQNLIQQISDTQESLREKPKEKIDDFVHFMMESQKDLIELNSYINLNFGNDKNLPIKSLFRLSNEISDFLRKMMLNSENIWEYSFEFIAILQSYIFTICEIHGYLLSLKKMASQIGHQKTVFTLSTHKTNKESLSINEIYFSIKYIKVLLELLFGDLTQPFEISVETGSPILEVRANPEDGIGVEIGEEFNSTIAILFDALKSDDRAIFLRNLKKFHTILDKYYKEEINNLKKLKKDTGNEEYFNKKYIELFEMHQKFKKESIILVLNSRNDEKYTLSSEDLPPKLLAEKNKEGLEKIEDTK